MSDVDEIMDFEYQSDEDEDETYLQLSKKYKRRHYENSSTRESYAEYAKKQRKTTDENRGDECRMQQVTLPCVDNWEEIETSSNQTTETEESHTLTNLDDNNSEENGKKNEETDKADNNSETQKDLKGTMKYSRSMLVNKRIQAVVPEISKNGWVLFVKSLHEEVTEVEVRNLFADYGEVCDIRMNMCRRTGFVAGYALVQYNAYEDALKAKEALHNTEFLGRRITVDWCFLQSPKD